MSNIVQLIQQYCPNGVEYLHLGTFAKCQTAKNKGSVCTLAYSITQQGLMPTSEYFKKATVTSEDVSGYRLVKNGWFVYSPSRIDVGSINYLRGADEVIVSPLNVVFSTDQSVILNEYLLYFLRSHSGMFQIINLRQGIEGTGRKTLPFDKFSKIKVPVPPIEVQQEIVRILDAMCELEASLKEELEARDKQLELYRTGLLASINLPHESPFKNGKADYIRGVTYNKSQESTDPNDSWRVLRANNITLNANILNFDDVKLVSKVVRVKPQQMLSKEDILICAGSGSKDHIGKVAYISENMDYTFGGFMAVIRCEEALDSRYMFHVLSSAVFKKYLARSLDTATINNLNKNVMNGFAFPIPPIEEQQEIVAKLDVLVALNQSLRDEITARHAQYEYYRDELLSFDKLEKGA